MPQYRDEGIVLRTQRLGEADRIVTVLTRNSGRVRAVAKGVRKTTSRFGARVEPFGHIDAHFHIGRSLDILSQISRNAHFGKTFNIDNLHNLNHNQCFPIFSTSKFARASSFL
jgi:DNA repair protein RecO (recombination protein O)